MSSTGDASEPSGSREIRITSHGKIQGWVSFALQHFAEHAERPLVLHTLPAKPKPGAVTATGNDAIEADDTPTEPTVAPAEIRERAEGKKAGLHASMSTIPRLVSVVEIIKREYLKTLDPALAEAGCLSGLHQYNEIGDLADEGFAEPAAGGSAEEERVAALARALQGKNHVKQKKTAFMRVTLSRKALADLPKRATYQQPALRRLSKSARSRLKKKKRAEEAAGGQEGQ